MPGNKHVELENAVYIIIPNRELITEIQNSYKNTEGDISRALDQLKENGFLQKLVSTRKNPKSLSNIQFLQQAEFATDLVLCLCSSQIQNQGKNKTEEWYALSCSFDRWDRISSFEMESCHSEAHQMIFGNKSW